MLKCSQCPFSAENKSELSLHSFLKHKKDSESKKRKNSSPQPSTSKAAVAEKRRKNSSPQPSTSKAAVAEKKAKIECSKCDFVAQEQFYMDIHNEVCKGKEDTEVASEDEVETENVADGPPTPKVEVLNFFDGIFNEFWNIEKSRETVFVH